MNRILYIKASPRRFASRTLSLSDKFIKKAKSKYPDLVVDELDLFNEVLPSMAPVIDGKYELMSGKELSEKNKEVWYEIEKYINQFQAADTILIATPMWNFGIPYVLKHYVDVIVQPRYLYHYTENGPKGLALPSRAFIITTRGGDYGPESPFHPYDQLEPYLKTVFGFIGVKDINFINAQPMDQGKDLMNKALQKAYAEIELLKI